MCSDDALLEISHVVNANIAIVKAKQIRSIASPMLKRPERACDHDRDSINMVTRKAIGQHTPSVIKPMP
jgi:hypothetical protein